MGYVRCLTELYIPVKGAVAVPKPAPTVHPKAKYAKSATSAYCEEGCPCCGEYMCTREPGHTGEHEAHGWKGEPCPIPTWSTVEVEDEDTSTFIDDDPDDIPF